MPIPSNVGEVRRFLGNVNQMNKFAPNLADVTKQIRDLLVKGNQWVWAEPQQRTFNQVKQMLSTSPILALFDPQLDTVVSADTSSFGLRAVLLQRQPEDQMKPVALYFTINDPH